MAEEISDKHKRQYKEINEYRDLLQAPDRFEPGFTAKTIGVSDFLFSLPRSGKVAWAANHVVGREADDS